MSAKEIFFERIKYLDRAANESVLVDDGIAPSAHNGAAALLRRGLGIVAFNMLEDFIKNRTVEAFDSISMSGISFENLTKKLQDSAIDKALSGLSFQAKIEKKAGRDWQSLIQDEALKIHSTGNGTFQISKFSLMSESSNIDADDVNSLLKCLGIDGGWATIKTVSDKISAGLTDPRQTYRNTSSRRHGAAHEAGFVYEHSWLSYIKDELIGIAATIDILVTARCRQVKRNPSVEMSSHNIDDDLKFIFLEKRGDVFRQTNELGGRSTKNWRDYEMAIRSLKPRLEGGKKFLITYDARQRISAWAD